MMKRSHFLLTLFLFSGAVGLIDEVVWTRMLTRALGTTVEATSTVLAAFMAGLALGGALGGRFARRARRPMLWYAWIELGVAVFAGASLVLLNPALLVPLYRSLNELARGDRSLLTPIRAAFCFLVLIPPAALMGATLPVLVEYAEKRLKTFETSVGFLYAMNTLGAVAGTIAAGFVLIGWIGETNTLLAAIGMNLLVGAGAIVADRLGAADGSIEPRNQIFTSSEIQIPINADQRRRRNFTIASFAIGGFTTLGLEVAWGRMLLLFEGTSIYAFSAMLAVLLTGMAIGGGFAQRRLIRAGDPLVSLGLTQFASGVATIIGLHIYAGLPFMEFVFTSKTLLLLNWVIAPLLLVGPLGFLSGASFSLAARCVATTADDASAKIGVLYAWNTFGCIAGSLLTGFFIMPHLGAAKTVALLASIGVAVGLSVVVLATHLSARSGGANRRLVWLAAGISVGFGIVVIGVGDPFAGLILKRAAGSVRPRGEIELYRHIEDAAATTTAFGSKSGDRLQKSLWINGYGMTQLVSVTKAMAHLPFWLADDPRNALVICYGMGTSARSASLHKNTKVRVVELVPGVIECASFFHPNAIETLESRNVEIVVGDGRNDLLLNNTRYDVIVVDPAPPLYAAGTVNLYNVDFFKLCRDRLTPTGAACIWLPVERHDESSMVLRGFVEAFPYVDIWSGGKHDNGFMLIGRHRPIVDRETVVRRGFENAAVAADLAEWDDEFASADKMNRLYLTDRAGLSEFVGSGGVNSDDHPYTEFPLWRAVFQRSRFNRFLAADHVREFVRNRTIASRRPTISPLKE